MAGKHLKFKKVTKFVHKRSEGLTKRGEVRQERLMLGPRSWNRVNKINVSDC